MTCRKQPYDIVVAGGGGSGRPASSTPTDPPAHQKENSDIMPVYAVTYTYTDDTAGRDEHRPAHKEHLGTLADKGVNLCSGPFGPEESPGALLLIAAATKDEALAATDGDPFRVEGLVAGVSVCEWVPVLGPLARQLG